MLKYLIPFLNNSQGSEFHDLKGLHEAKSDVVNPSYCCHL